MSDSCFHCGQNVEKEQIIFDEKLFCCQGCKSVYEILNLHNLEDFYQLNKRSGIRPHEESDTQFNYLDTPEIFEKIVDFSEGDLSIVTLKIPVIHCSSCIWLLESLHTINPNIVRTHVNFTRKTMQITFKHHDLKLSELAVFLTQLGYKPVINLETVEKKEEYFDKTLLVKLAIAGFAFGNGMFLSFPEYVGGNDAWLEQYKIVFRYLMFALATPVTFYSASDYFRSAWYGLKNKVINIDVPIVLGIIVLYCRSMYEVITDYGPGYFDTLCGLLFFMLLGKVFQRRTYTALSYDRDYKSFYPIAVTKVDFEGKQENILLSDIKIGDRILVRNQEIIPVDAILISGSGNIDNSFITGESATVEKKPGEKIFAGGKQSGATLELEVIKNVNQSYLTQLWNKEAFKKADSSLDTITNKVSKYFTLIILSITLISAIYWYPKSTDTMFQVVSAILIIACPCALALSAPFTFGHIMRILGRNKFYVKDTITIERIAQLDSLVFDKTGTLTERKKTSVQYEGQEISDFDLKNIKTLAKNSNHPLSKILYEHLPTQDEYFEVENYEEISGKGYTGVVRNHCYKIGSANYNNQQSVNLETAVYISNNSGYIGKFIFRNEYRSNLTSLFQKLKKYSIYILSGDNSSEAKQLSSYIPSVKEMQFNQSPEDKLHFIEKIQKEGKLVAMLGDGLNDAGALKQSNVGIAIADDTHTFTPSSDVIMHGDKVGDLYKYLEVCKKSIGIVKLMFTISFFYNIIGLSFAVTGHMDPLFAAILMPISTVTIVSLTTLTTWMLGRKYFSSK